MFLLYVHNSLAGKGGCQEFWVREVSFLIYVNLLLKVVHCVVNSKAALAAPRDCYGYFACFYFQT